MRLFPPRIMETRWGFPLGVLYVVGLYIVGCAITLGVIALGALAYVLLLRLGA